MKLLFEKLLQCPICGSKDFKHHFRRQYLDHAFNWVRCPSCGATFQNPCLTSDSLGRIFNSQNYWNGKSVDQNRLTYYDYKGDESRRLKQAQKRMNEIMRYVRPPASVLEIGCATGSFLKVLSEKGFKTRGVELSREMAEFGHQNYHLDIIVGDLKDIELNDMHDLVTIWGGDGCFYDMAAVVKKANRLLKDNGYLALNYFDFDFFKRFGGNFKKVPTAVCNFSIKSMNTLLDKCGFRIISAKTETCYMGIEKILGLMGNYMLINGLKRIKMNNITIKFPLIGSYLVIAEKVAKV